MFKTLLVSLSLLALAGCNSAAPKAPKETKPLHKTEAHAKKMEHPMHHKKHTMTKMFQSVDKKDATLVQNGPNKEHCAICGMNLVKFYKTSHAAKVDGHNVQYCSIHCLADHVRHGAELENPMVVDVTSLKLIPVTEAYYVVGSDVHGTMSMVSKYAFKNLSDAQAFVKKHGGKIMDFRGAWEVAKKDFKK